jgi:hypothetical protein
MQIGLGDLAIDGNQVAFSFCQWPSLRRTVSTCGEAFKRIIERCAISLCQSGSRRLQVSYIHQFYNSKFTYSYHIVVL